MGSFAIYFGYKKPTAPQNPDTQKTVLESKEKPKLVDSIPKDKLEKSRKELRTYLLEKELVSAALTRLYEAEAAKEITVEEREILGAKYKTELKSLDENISKIDALIQIGDLETLRNQLLQLVNQKMDAIDNRIESTKKIAAPLIADMMRKPLVEKIPPKLEEHPKVPDISDLLEKPREVAPAIAAPSNAKPALSIPANGTSAVTINQTVSSKRSGDKVEELQKELLDALDRLEKLDVET